MACEITHDSVKNGIIDKVVELVSNSKNLSIKDNKVVSNNKDNTTITSLQSSKKSLDVLQVLKNSNNILKPLANHLTKFVELNNTDIEFISDEAMAKLSKNSITDRAVGLYVQSANKIYILKRIDNEKQLTNVLLHEIIHSISSRIINTNSEAKVELQKYYDIASKTLNKYNKKDNTGEYAMANLDEFLVGVFTNAGFIKKLQNIETTEKTQYKNLFEEIIDYVLGILKIPKTNNTLYTEAFAVATNILEEQKYNEEMYEEFKQSLNEGVKDSFNDILPSNDLSEINNTNNLSKEKSEAIDSIFKQSPELANIGSAQQYSQYLDNIFPDSKVKDIVYHGTKGKKFDSIDFSKNVFGKNVFYVSKFEYEAKAYATKEGNIIPILINSKNIQFQRDAFFGNNPQSIKQITEEVKNIKEAKFALQYIAEELNIRIFNSLDEANRFAKSNSGWEKLEEDVKKEKLKELENTLNILKTQGEFDTVLTNNDGGEQSIYILNKSEQIHILGNEKDIKEFKSFVKENTNKSNNKDNQENINQQDELGYIDEQTNDNKDFIDQKDVSLLSEEDIKINNKIDELLNNGDIIQYCQ